MIDKDKAEIREVVRAYELCIRKSSGNAFLTASPINESGKTFTNALWVYSWCRENKISLVAYFEEAFKIYSDEWMRKTFKHPYIPLPMAVSQKAWDTTKKQFGNKGGPDGELETVRKVLKNYTPDMQELLLENSLGWISSETKKLLKQER